MAKFTFFEVSSGVFNNEQTGQVVSYDNVSLMFTKRVNRKNMIGEKGELYSVPVNDIPYLFGEDVKFPGPVGDDYSRRVEAVVEFLKPYIGKQCVVEQIKKKDRDIITYVEFES